MQQYLTIPARFRGPPQSGNGGYVAGATAQLFSATQSAQPDAAIEVTLRAPIPLDRQMSVITDQDARLSVVLGETLIVEAHRATLQLEVPQPPSFAEALAARPKSPSFLSGINDLIAGTGFHPICFCCGADVAEDEGLHVYAAPVSGFDGVAAAWTPSAAFADAQGNLPEAIVWAALDCPGQFAYMAEGIRTGMLGRMTGRVLKPIQAAQNLVIIGWTIEVERSKHFAGTAIFAADGELCGYSRQVWIGRRD